MPLELGPHGGGPIANLGGRGAKLRLIEHFFHVAERIGPRSEVAAGQWPSRAARRIQQSAKTAAAVGIAIIASSALIAGVLVPAILVARLIASHRIGDALA